MKGQYTTDGKCLACELEAKGVNLKKLRHKVRHVCRISRPYSSIIKEQV